MQDTDELNAHRLVKGDEEEEDEVESSLWEPSGTWWKDFLYFSGPGWFVSIAYVDPGNYQADIQAGATSRYSLLFALWWTGILSIYVQILCVRLAFHARLTLSQVQAQTYSSKRQRYVYWAIAEFSTIITDLPTVIGFAIAINYFFGWPYYIGVLMSILTTMVFLASLSCGMRLLEGAICIFVAIMSIALWVEMSFVGPDTSALLKGWAVGFVDMTRSDIFSLAGIMGSVVMPHNLYLHTAAVQSKTHHIKQSPDVIKKAVKFCSIEPIIPIIISFFVNMAVVSIAAESVYGSENASSVGLTDFCTYFQNLKGGCLLWSIALLAAGQSGAITTTYTGQYVMDGFLNIQLPLWTRSIITRLVAIAPSLLISIMYPDKLNHLVNIVNALLGLLLPFAFTPLVKFNCSESIMGEGNASKGIEKGVLYSFAIAVWAVNAMTLSMKGGGFFGEITPDMPMSAQKVLLVLLQVVIQLTYAWWNFSTLFGSVGGTKQSTNVEYEGESLALPEVSNSGESSFENEAESLALRDVSNTGQLS
mmetsp:Transcript_31370/g.66025  ORF Transcript_31370/g.66025 Transcript_31370/m.66025 type:complete len:533 (-) Transcript_31370:1220-2818(-)|eukprot:CAMPEP_0172318618 /NCGR_PEP_ID=MMETSP1058-20130122/35402_1 /TAXON_ID=83371 /ORGANISM="Detonula confervacea, Strain CCMP 353" /LENGTH=532 /DNA_ID=CAMNT_0013033493 /DNA_START=47 /DNA_END=1645 /DNA_ORIENTATION=+